MTGVADSYRGTCCSTTSQSSGDLESVASLKHELSIFRNILQLLTSFVSGAFCRVHARARYRGTVERSGPLWLLALALKRAIAHESVGRIPGQQLVVQRRHDKRRFSHFDFAPTVQPRRAIEHSMVITEIIFRSQGVP
jgi:hypothetical protein